MPRLVSDADGTSRPDRSWSDGLALSISAALSAGAGMLSWVLAARFVSPTAVGEVSAFVSAFLLVAGLTEFNLGVALMRWVPTGGRRVATLVGRSLLGATIATAIVAPLYLLLPGTEVIRQAAGGGAPAVAVFVLAAVGWSALHLLDFIMVAVDKPWWSVARNLLLGGSRITILLLLGAGADATVLLWAWVGPIVACAVVFGIAAVVVTVRHGRAAAESSNLPARREVVGFLGPTWVGSLALALLYHQVPLLITFRFGPDVGGRFFIVWQAVAVIDIVATYFVSSLSSTVARNPGRIVTQARRALRRLLALFLPALAIGAVFAGPLLGIFGPQYVELTSALRILLAGAAARLIVVHVLGVRQAIGDATGFARPHIAVAATTLASLAVVPTVAGNVALSAAWVFVGVHIVAAATLLSTQPARVRAIAPQQVPKGKLDA